MTALKVVPLPVLDLREIPANLRRLADEIEKGETPHAAIVVLGMKDGEAQVYGYGPNMDGLRLLGWLQLATDVGVRNCMVRRPLTAEG